MKKLLLAIMVLVVAVALVMTGCSKESSTTAVQTTPTSTTQASSTPVKVTKLTFANWMPPPDVAAYSGTFDKWAADFGSLTGGRYDVEVVHGGVLAGVPDSYDAVANGIADIAQFIPQDTDHPFPMMSVVALPFNQVRSDIATKALHEVWKQGFFDKEFSDVKILFFNTSASSDDLITIKPISTLAELKGLKIATGGGSRVDLIKALGATPVFCPPPEVYGMLQKGTVDGVMISGYGLYPDHTADFLTCIVNPVRFFRVTHVIAMNKDVYNKMPADVQKIVDDMDKDAKYSAMGAKTLADEYDAIIAKFLSSTGKEVALNAADTAVVEAACADIFKKWMADMDGQGLPGSDILKAYYNALKAQGVEKPAMGYTP